MLDQVELSMRSFIKKSQYQYGLIEYIQTVLADYKTSMVWLSYVQLNGVIIIAVTLN